MKRRMEREKERTSLVSPPVASIASLLVPGLGQMLAGEVQRGLLLLGSFISIIGLSVWRIVLLGTERSGALAIFLKAAERRPLLVWFLAIAVAGLYIWTVMDAWRQAKKERRGGAGLFVAVIVVFFALGWQISQIDIYRAITKLPDAWPPLAKVLWPWQEAITYRTETVSAAAEILTGSTVNPPVAPAPKPGEPYLKVVPNFGMLSTIDSNNNVVPGTTIHLEGSGFRPNTDTQIWWIDILHNEFRPRENGEYVHAMTDSSGSFSLDMTMPYRMLPPNAGLRQINNVEARQVRQIGGPIASEPLRVTIERMIETIIMGMMATVFGIILSIPVSFLAARNLMAGSWIGMTIYYLTRTVLNIVRSIEPLIWALIAVVWVGLGPFAGIVALTIHSVAALGKLYSEAIEGIDPGPIEAIQATGATRLQTIVHAVIPQMIPPFVSFSIYRWDTNVRMSTVIGLVGGGGVGFILVQYVRLLDYRAAGIAVWFIAVTVALLDYVSAEIRRRFV